MRDRLRRVAAAGLLRLADLDRRLRSGSGRRRPHPGDRLDLVERTMEAAGAGSTISATRRFAAPDSERITVMPQVIVTMGRGRTAEQRCAPREAIVDSIHGPIGAPRASTRVRSAEGGHTDLPAGTAVPTDERARLAAEWVPA